MARKVTPKGHGLKEVSWRAFKKINLVVFEGFNDANRLYKNGHLHPSKTSIVFGVGIFGWSMQS